VRYKKGPKALSFYRFAIYIVISKPKRRSVAVGVVHFIVFSLVCTATLFNHFSSGLSSVFSLIFDNDHEPSPLSVHFKVSPGFHPASFSTSSGNSMKWSPSSIICLTSNVHVFDIIFGAGCQNRTDNKRLEISRFTIKLIPHSPI